MLGYYALYDHDDGWERGEPPLNVIVELTDEPAVPGDTIEYHAVLWNHQSKAWVYDPDTSADILNDLDTYGDRFRPVERDEAELITPAITDGEELPDEDTIRWIFQWRGDPPQALDRQDDGDWAGVVWPGTKPPEANGT